MESLDSGGLGRLAYLVLLGCAIFAGVVTAYRGRLGTGLRDAAIWILIFIGFIAAFALREDIAAALMPSEATVSQGGEILIPRSMGGHFHVRADVNGEPVTFLVDTGASGVVLTADDARRVGIDPASLEFTSSAQTANGTVRLAPVRLSTLSLGPVHAEDVRATVSEGELFTNLLGMDFLNRFRRVTVEGDRMVLTP